MPMAAADGRTRDERVVRLPTGRDVPFDAPSRFRHEKEEPMSATVATPEQGSKRESSLRFWRVVVFSGIGLLYLLSLFVPSLREALAKFFSYFPQ